MVHDVSCLIGELKRARQQKNSIKKDGGPHIDYKTKGAKPGAKAQLTMKFLHV